MNAPLDRVARLYLRLREEGAPHPMRAWRFAVAAIKAMDSQDDLDGFVADVMTDIQSIPTAGGACEPA